MRDAEAAPLLAHLPEGEKYSTWRLAEPDGRLLDRGPASAELLGRLGGGRLRAVALRVEGLLEGAYELVARHRSFLGHLVPDGPAPRSFP